MSITNRDRDVLRSLAEEVAEIGSLPVHQVKAGLWTQLNQLKPVKPMVWMNEIPWHELGPAVELITSSEFCRIQERRLRQVLYQWRRMPCDMVVNPRIYCPLVVHDTGFGIQARAVSAEGYSGFHDQIKVDGASHFDPVIENEKDIRKIQMPQVEVDWDATEENYHMLDDIFSGILPVEKRGVGDFELLPVVKKSDGNWKTYGYIFGLWFAPLDDIATWIGIENLYDYMITRPDFIREITHRLVDAWLHRLDQYEKLNVLALNDGPTRVGSGGYGYTTELPQHDYDQTHVRPVDIWGSCATQIFAGVSPKMHEEFALRYEMNWLKRFGLTYYGCCEPLNKKIPILKNIPNLRKISISPWVKLEEATEAIGEEYVLSLKPSPSIFAAEHWNLADARAQLLESLEKTRGCRVEVIMKDISTCLHRPKRLWEWARMAMEVTEDFH